MNTPNRMYFLPQVDSTELSQVLLVWQSAFPKMGVCAFVPEAQKEDVTALQAQCAKLHVPLVGAIFPALIKDGQFMTSGLWLLRLDEMPYHALYADLPQDAEAAEQLTHHWAQEISAQLAAEDEATLFMLFDAMVPNVGSLLDNLYLDLANRVHYTGANAGSETFQPMPCLFDAERLISNGLLLLLLPNHKGAVVEHGYHAPEHSVYATSTSGNCISHIDWRPAFEVYQELVQSQHNVHITAENFYQHAVHFPFGILRANHHVVVRIPVMLKDDGSLFCVGEVPANSVLTLLKSPSVDSQETLQVLDRGLAAMNGQSQAPDLLLFYCAGRRMHLGLDQATVELAEFEHRTGDSQVAGVLTLGEIGSSTVHGYPLFHNAALVATHW
jgi:hypothetical protein